jgi:hypothetical protein
MISQIFMRAAMIDKIVDFHRFNKFVAQATALRAAMDLGSVLYSATRCSESYSALVGQGVAPAEDQLLFDAHDIRAGFLGRNFPYRDALKPLYRLYKEQNDMNAPADVRRFLKDQAEIFDKRHEQYCVQSRALALKNQPRCEP